MKKKLSVSVVITTFNGERFIEEQLDSIRTQSRKPDEVLIFDDVSNDRTAQLVEEYIKKYNITDCWTLEVNPYNKGYAQNYVDSITRARSDLIFLCDQDDIWVHDKIEKMTSIMENKNSIGLLCSNLEPYYYEEGGRKWDKKDIDAMKNDGTLEYPIFSYNTFFLQRSGCTMCVRKEYFNKIKSFWIEGWAHDDFLWKFALADKCLAIYEYTTLKRRMHKNNASTLNIRTRDWRIEQIEGLIHQGSILKCYVGNKCTEKQVEEIINKNLSCLYQRKNMLETKNLFRFILIVARYRKCFPRMKAVLLDLYLTIFNQYNGIE